jgi:hypothetical protein
MRKFMPRCALRIQDDHGVALFAAIAGLVVLSTMIAALAILARNENLIAQLNKDEAQAAYAAEAGANWGRRVLHRIFQTDLPARVFATPRTAMNSALQTTRTSVGAAQFIRDFAIPASGPQFVACSPCPDPMYSAVYSDASTKQITDNLQSVLTLTCPGTAGCPANMVFTARVIVSAHPTIPPAIMPGTDVVGALFTYVWRIESSGTAGRARQQYVILDSSVPLNLAGSFTIALNGEFVKYAHFIDQFQDAGPGGSWMSYRDVYTGPVHTNTRFSILGDSNSNEGPTFRSEATQSMPTTRFSNRGNEQNLHRDSSSQDWPRLGPDPGILCKLQDCSGFTRGFDFDPTTPGNDRIPFPSGNNPNERLDQICVALGIAQAGCPRRPAAAPTPATISCGDPPSSARHRRRQLHRQRPAQRRHLRQRQRA